MTFRKQFMSITSKHSRGIHFVILAFRMVCLVDIQHVLHTMNGWPHFYIFSLFCCSFAHISRKWVHSNWVLRFLFAWVPRMLMCSSLEVCLPIKIDCSCASQCTAPLRIEREHARTHVCARTRSRMHMNTCHACIRTRADTGKSSWRIINVLVSCHGVLRCPPS